MKISFAEPGAPNGGALVVGVGEGRVLSSAAATLDRDTGNALTRAISTSRFQGAKDQVLSVLAPANLKADRIILAGLGKIGHIGELQLQDLGGGIIRELQDSSQTDVAVWLGDLPEMPVPAGAAAAHIAFGARLGSYRFDKYRTRLEPEQRAMLESFTVLTASAAAARSAFAGLDTLTNAVFIARDLASEPANTLYPQSLAERTLALCELGVQVEILDEKQLGELGMGALLGVGQGSVRPARLIVMRWNGAGDIHAAPAVFIGKGITFDSGGISLKAGAGMEEMKWDMAGAGAVIGLMMAVAARHARANVVGIVAAAENMPDGGAIRPGDILTSASGQTIEVNNTDAEGRLVLADALWYAQERFSPALMVDLATLTGAMGIALGAEYAGVFSNDDLLAERLIASGKATGENLWRMPLGEGYDRQIDSDVADVKNVSASRDAAPCIGAVFLQRFVKGTKWAHLDIDAMAWNKKGTAIAPKGATGYGVRLLDCFLSQHFEA